MHLLRTFIHALVVLALALGGSHLKAAGGVILVVESYHAEYDWDESYTQALKEILGKDYKLEFFRMDTKRLPPEKHPAMADAAWEKYQALRGGNKTYHPSAEKQIRQAPSLRKARCISARLS